MQHPTSRRAFCWSVRCRCAERCDFTCVGVCTESGVTRPPTPAFLACHFMYVCLVCLVCVCGDATSPGGGGGGGKRRCLDLLGRDTAQNTPPSLHCRSSVLYRLLRAYLRTLLTYFKCFSPRRPRRPRKVMNKFFPIALSRPKG